MSLNDPAAERAVLAGIYKYGSGAYLDICDMVKVGTFSIKANQCIWKCLDHICRHSDDAVIDLPSILSVAKELGLNTIIERPEEAKHLNSIMQLHVDRSNVRKFAGKIRKLEIARLIHKQGQVLQDKMTEIQGTEPISLILGTAEEVIFDFTSLLDDGEANPIKIGTNLEQYLDYLGQNPVKQMGISTGFNKWDEAIGGGLRPGTLNVIAARPKVGKTILSDNMGYNIASNGIPVLNLDTEMLKEDHQHRSLAMLSNVKIHDIETGQFSLDEQKKKRVYEAAKKINDVPYFHKSIAGANFEDQIALMRRWLQKSVGLNVDGTAKQCVIIYDYLKLMESTGISDSLHEFQLLGFMMTTLHNFSVRYRIPIIIFMQLNRDGITREGTDTASGSDRIVWLCSNFTIFKLKSEEEIAEDGPEVGNRKMVVIVTRHGEGTMFGDYINCYFDAKYAKIREGKRKNDPNDPDRDNFVICNNGDDIPFNE